MGTTNDKKLDSELAKISIVKSVDAVALAKDTNSLYDMQEKINENVNSVSVLKTILETSKPYELDQAIAGAIDAELKGSHVPLDDGKGESVVGAEQLGLTLVPSQYLKTRLGGCESFLSETASATVILIKRMGANFKNQYLLLAQSVESLQERLDLLAGVIGDSPYIPSNRYKLEIGYRLFNTFRTNNKLDEKWVNGFGKVDNTIKALTSSYYKNYTNNLNGIFSYFGGFEGLTREQAESRFLKLGSAVPDNIFKECIYVNQENTNKEVVARNSMTLMGDWYFLNTVDIDKKIPVTVDDINSVIDSIIKYNKITFVASSEINYGKAPTIGNLGTDDITSLHKLMSATLNSITKIHSGADKLDLGSTEYLNIIKSISGGDWGGLEERITRAFERVVLFKANELSNIRSEVTNYLVLLINALIQLCNDSIDTHLSALEE